MAITYYGLIRGNHNPLDIAKVIKNTYGGDDFAIRFSGAMTGGHYTIGFNEQPSPNIMMMKPWERRSLVNGRLMTLHTDGSCACDYEEVSTEPCTMISLGHAGECREIINSVVAHFGGWVKDELSAHPDTKDVWVEWIRTGDTTNEMSAEDSKLFEQRLMSHYGISQELWDKLNPEQQARQILATVLAISN